MHYPKINTLWKRDKATNQIIPGDYSCPEFASIKNWHVTEKVDGTNIRITFIRMEEGDNNPQPSIQGRQDTSQIPPHLRQYLHKHFTYERLAAFFPKPGKYTLFGEGYGPKIQDVGSKYRDDVGFILFDVKIDNWWIKQEDLEGMAKALEIPRAPVLGIMTEPEIIELVKDKPLSKCSKDPLVIEGVVCRSEPLMHCRSGEPVMWKLKVRDFKS